MSKKRDKEYGPKPQDVPLKREDLPQTPARLPKEYCKKAKAEHVFELDHIDVYKHLGYPSGMPLRGPLYFKGFTNWKWYRCTACGKKKYITERHELDEPVLWKKEHS